jgi:ornithine--oxo-acid transaminase
VPKDGWLKELRKLCIEKNILLILDEIQSGLGRTGKLFAYQHEDIVPDGLILGKALGGALLPISAFLGSKDLMQHFNPGSHGSTFGGNPLAAKLLV